VGLTYKLPLNNGLNTKLNIGIKNIFDAYQDDLDQGTDRDPAYVFGSTRPRTFYFGIQTAF
jgi:outer membrane receptor for ferrienterochelin and colicins